MKVYKKMAWCFAIINNRLAEIYFDKKNEKTKIIGHCYVKKEDYKRKSEQKWIKEDTTKFQFIYRKNKYKRVLIKLK